MVRAIFPSTLSLDSINSHLLFIFWLNFQSHKNLRTRNIHKTSWLQKILLREIILALLNVFGARDNVCVPNRTVMYTQLTFSCREWDDMTAYDYYFTEKQQQKWTHTQSKTHTKCACSTTKAKPLALHTCNLFTADDRHLEFLMLWWVH